MDCQGGEKGNVKSILVKSSETDVGREFAESL